MKSRGWERAGLVILLSLVVSMLAGACAVPVATPTPAPTATPAPALTPTPTPTAAPAAWLAWLGHSAFLLRSSTGTRVLIDPPSAGMGGYSFAPMAADAVLITHEHPDHNNVGLATGSPLILRGLSATGWNAIDQWVKDIHIYSVPTYHDAQQGAQRGRNSIFVLEVDGLRIAHLGDLGHVLTPEAVQAIGPLDVVLIPVGGVYTIDAAVATNVVGQLNNPKLVIPMHYKTPMSPAGWPGTGVEPFLEGKRVELSNDHRRMLYRPFLPAQSTVVVLSYEQIMRH